MFISTNTWLFLAQTPEREFIIKISAMEIYNENVKDLLQPDSAPLRLLDDPEVCLQSDSHPYALNKY
jgi:hypothetical protein